MPTRRRLPGTWTKQTSRKRTDGQVGTVSAWKGLPWGETGYVTIAAEYKDQNHTERSGYDIARSIRNCRTVVSIRAN
ncbi:hypothetical protein LP419_20085 [Massilia sp. H-1]|nr:hypothetical protein LP419_20085 [Massilia sp. H-1]